MIETIHEALEMLMARKNMKLGVEGLVSALAEYDNPHLKLKTIHIGGTNGKGSTTDFTRNILQEYGEKVGTFTSPHLESHNDRIRINDVPISDANLLAYLNQTEAVWRKYQLSMFEIDMLISCLYFLDEAVDVCIYEVGLGGRLDATNVIHPQVSAITHVDYDHMEILGDTLEQIAFEKAGIVKPGVLLLTAETKQNALAVFKTITTEKGAPLQVVQIPPYVMVGNTLTFELDHHTIKLSDQAVYQVENASLACRIVQAYAPDVEWSTLIKGIETTHWAGRFEQVLDHVYVDGAHNINGVQKLVESLALVAKPWTIVFTALRDKDHFEMIDTLEKVADTLILTEFDFYRAAPSETLAQGHHSQVIVPYEKALDYAIENRNGGTVLVTGSLYFISEAREYLRNKGK